MSAKRNCLVCSAPSTFAHFGVNVCRSCGDFFKRTVTSNRRFVCRQGDGKCTINQKDRHNCRGCRYDKCKKLGIQLTEQKPDESEPLESQPSSSNEPQESMILRVSREYKASVARRRICEFTLQPTSLSRHVKADFDGEDLLLCTFTFLMDCLKLHAGDYIHFATSAFPEFAALSLDDQRIMLKNFASRFYTMESHCNTFRTFGSHDGPFYMATLTACHDMRKPYFFTEEENPDTNSEVVKLMTYYTDVTRRMLEPILSRSQFTETEYIVLYALSIWQIEPNKNLSDNIVSLTDNMRRNVFDCLKGYYRDDLGLEDYSVRLGNLISFEHTIQECTNLLDEEVQSYNLAGLLNADLPFLQIVLQIPL